MNKEMVQALGINIKRVFLFVFMVGAGMAALGGVLLGPYSGVIHAGMGMEFAILRLLLSSLGGWAILQGLSLLRYLLVCQERIWHILFLIYH